MRRWRVALVCLIILSMSVTAFGCLPTRPEEDDNSLDPGSVETPVDPEDQDSSGINDNNDEDTETTSTDLNTSVLAVPQTAADNISFAVIRQGDLWLGSPNGQMWRQTNTGNVSEVVWAPDGHGLAYIQSISWDTKHLYYLVPGSSPTLVDQNVILNRNWRRPMGLLWSPNSAGLAYGIADGEQLRITQVPGLAQSSYLLSKPIQQGPYWLAEDVLVYGTGRDDLPSVLLLDSSGQLIAEMLETISPYPVPGGSLVVTGTYDPEGMMENFYSSGLALVGLDGVIVNDVYDKPVWNFMLAVSPAVVQHPLDPRYVAISTGERLVLQQYAGAVTKLNPTRKELLTQDVFLTFSEFLYPLWFDWAPDGSQLAALRFSFTREGDYGQQEGHWDLVLVDKQANQQILLAELYSVSDDNQPIPFLAFPMNWSPCGNYVNYLIERDGDGTDLWRVDIRNQQTEVVLEECGLPVYRPYME